MTIDEAIADLTARINSVSVSAVVLVQRRSAEETAIRVYAPADEAAAIRSATQQITISLLTIEGLDVHVLVYDTATSLPPSQ